MLSGAPGTFSSSQCPVHPSSTGRRGRSKGSGGGSTTEGRSEVKGQGPPPLNTRSFHPLPLTKSLRLHHLGAQAAAGQTGSATRILGVSPAPKRAEVEATSVTHPRPGGDERYREADLSRGSAGRKCVALSRLGYRVLHPSRRHRSEPALRCPRGRRPRPWDPGYRPLR